jgi:predicted O-methyltransferase YrrM
MHRITSFVKYLTRAKGVHGAHSDFIFKLFHEVFNDNKVFYAFSKIEKKRARLKSMNSEISVVDFGAKGDGQTVANKIVSQIATKALKHPRYARLMFRLINQMRYTEVLELGTSLGITTLYLSEATKGSVLTIDASESISKIASGLNEENRRIDYRINTFDNELPALSDRSFDFIFIDGDHKGESLLRYYDLLRPRLRDNGCIVIDDINWSPDMTAAWARLCGKPDISLSLDLFELGILFSRPGMVKQHHVIRY